MRITRTSLIPQARSAEFGRSRAPGLPWRSMGSFALEMLTVVANTGATVPSEPRGLGHIDRGFAETKLVSNVAGRAALTDPNLVNPWGISWSTGTPLWVSDNGSGRSTLYDGAGVPNPLVVSIPAPGSAGPGATGTPTGQVSNTANTGFAVSKAGLSGPSRFLFATEDGTLIGWSPALDRLNGIIAVDRSTATDPEGDKGAVYKGLALASTAAGQFLYATNFRFGQVEVFDSSFALVRTFTDPAVPSGYGPFGIHNIGGKLFVTFAKQDGEKHDDVAGAGSGFVDVFDTSGVLLQRFARNGALNSPWAVTMAPASFGAFGGDILVGNFGDGRINAYAPRNGHFVGTLRNDRGGQITIPGLWDLKVPVGAVNVTAGAVYFTAGPDQEANGLLGYLLPNPKKRT